MKLAVGQVRRLFYQEGPDSPQNRVTGTVIELIAYFPHEKGNSWVGLPYVPGDIPSRAYLFDDDGDACSMQGYYLGDRLARKPYYTKKEPKP